MRVALEKRGVVAGVAAGVLEAREILHAEAPELLIVDVRLAGDMDGLELADWARQRYPELAIIVITGHGSPESERRSAALGAVGYLEKPFEFHELFSQLDRAIERRELLHELHRLEQELAAARAGVSDRLVSDLALVCVAQSGAVEYATGAGQQALEAVSDPNLPRPLAWVEPTLAARLWAAAESGQSVTTVFRRDGVLSHYLASSRRIEVGGRVRLVSQFVAEQETGQILDDLWVGLLLQATAWSADEATGSEH